MHPVGKRADRIPVAGIAGRHVAEREPQNGRVDNAAEHVLHIRCHVVVVRERLVDLRAGSGQLVLLVLERPHGEDGHRHRRERGVMTVQEPARVAMRAAHVEGGAEDDAVVAIDGRHVGRLQQLDMPAVLAEADRDGVRHLTGRTVLGRICDE